MPEKTTIEVHVSTWRELNTRKQPGDSFDDVIRRTLNLQPNIDWDSLADTYDLNHDERDAVKAIYNYITSNEEASKQAVIDDLHDTHTAGKTNPDWWWRQLVKHVLVDADYIQQTNQGRVKIKKL